MGKEALQEKKKNPFSQTARGEKACVIPAWALGWLLLVLHPEAEKLPWLVGSINVLQEKDKQLSTELLMFMEKVERLSFQPLEEKQKEFGAFGGNDTTRQWCFQEGSELANRNGVLAYRFYFCPSCRHEESTDVTGKINKNEMVMADLGHTSFSTNLLGANDQALGETPTQSSTVRPVRRWNKYMSSLLVSYNAHCKAAADDPYTQGHFLFEYS